MITALNIVAVLTAITGPEHLRHLDDSITVSPADTAEISAIAKFANENSLTLTPIGGATKQSWGNPTRTDIKINLTRLNRVLEHPWQDLTCTVQAGCTWQRLQQTLAQHHQFVALDPLFADRATVGGILATNDSGALRHRYGSLRDLVIGMTLVLADGTIARSGGKVVKNVAGYDLCKLLTGSFGTLAIITEATFRLHPLPQHAQTFTVSALQAAQLAPLMQPIRASHLLTQALQLRGDPTGFHLDIQLNAHSEAHQPEILRQMTESAGLRLESASEDIWTARETLFSNPANIALKATMLPADVPHIAEKLSSLGGNSVTQSCGIMIASLPFNMRDAIKLLRREFAAKAVSLTLLQPMEAVEPFGQSGDSLPLMQRVKHQFDPRHTLNPGRLLVTFLLAFLLFFTGGCALGPTSAAVSTPALVSTIPIPYLAYSSVMIGNNTVALTASDHLIMVDVSNPTTPAVINSVDTTALGIPDGLATDFAYLYVGMYDTSLFAIYSLANPGQPALVGSVTACSAQRTVLLAAPYAYLGCAGAMSIVNIANPAAPTLTGTYTISDVANANISSIELDGQVATIAFSTPASSYVRTIDVSIPAAPVALGDIATLHSLQRATQIGTGIYTSFFDTSVVNAFSISNPTAITQTASLPLPTGCEGTPLVPANGLLYLGCYGGGLARINISNPANPVLKDFTAGPSFQSISINSQYLFGIDDTNAAGPQLHVYTLGTNP